MDYGDRQEKRVGLETVRALHQTVIALRAALEESKNEILELKSTSLPVESIQEALKNLSIENCELRQRLLVSVSKDSDKTQAKTLKLQEVNCKENTDENSELIRNQKDDQEILVKGRSSRQESNSVPTKDTEDIYETIKPKRVTFSAPTSEEKTIHRNIQAKILIKVKTISPRNISKSLESLTIINSALKENNLSFSKTVSFSNLSEHISPDFNGEVDTGLKMSESGQHTGQYSEVKNQEDLLDEPSRPKNDMDQVDEVDDIELIFTTNDTKETNFKEQLVSIDAQEGPHDNSNLLQLPLDDIDQNGVSDREMDDDVFNDNFENENQENAGFHNVWKREQSQLYDSMSDTSINQEKSLKSYSLQDSSFENKSLEKDESFDRFEERIHIVETDISKCGIQDIEYSLGRRNTCPNPILYKPFIHREAMSKSFMFTRQTRPILTQSNAVRKESGAQTDISALPGSSWRSESSLAHKAQLSENFTTLPSKCPLPNTKLRLSEKTVEARRMLLSDIGFTSMVPELSRSADHLFPSNLRPSSIPTYGQFLRTTDLYSPGCTSQKFSWVATTTSTSNGSQSQSRYSSLYPLSSPPAPSRRCSAPVSPSRKTLMKQTISKVRFANGSLPELHGDWTVDSGDSTDSLVEEAENYLRRSIDCIMIRRDTVSSLDSSKKSIPRRASAPEPSGDNVPPSGWQPFLPRVPRDLKLDHWIKVITPEGRVRGGRVRYVGLIILQTEQFVGVQLGSPEGYCDGTYNNRRYFQCEPCHGLFVPFKKVIMGWRP